MDEQSRRGEKQRIKARQPTTVRLDEPYIVETEEFIRDYRKRHPNLEITFAQAVRYLIMQGAAFERYRHSEQEAE